MDIVTKFSIASHLEFQMKPHLFFRLHEHLKMIAEGTKPHEEPALQMLCYSNDSDIELRRIGLTSEGLRANCFSGTDYENSLTDEDNCRAQYNLKAFYTKEDIAEGDDLLKKWRSFLTDKHQSINSHAT